MFTSGIKKREGNGSLNPRVVKLPPPARGGGMTLEEALAKRRSIREFRNEPLTLSDVSQLLWSAQGVTDPNGYRTAPSAGALYPLEAYLVAGKVTDLRSGIYKYDCRRHQLIRVVDGDKRGELSRAALEQSCVRSAAVVLAFTAVFERTTVKYGKRGTNYVCLEAGHAAQNVHLQAVSLGLGSVPVGAFEEDRVKRLLQLPVEERPMYLLAVGHAAPRG